MSWLPQSTFKIIYHNNVKKSVALNTGLKSARRIREVILDNLLAISTMLKECSGRVDMVDLDVHEDGVRPIPDGNFKFIQLNDNPIIYVNIGFRLPFKVKYALIECLWANAYLLAFSPNGMPDIELIVVFH